MAARLQCGTMPTSCVTCTGICTCQKRCQHSQTSRAQSPLNLLYTWCNMLLTGLHQSPVVSIPLFLPSNSSILPPSPSLPYVQQSWGNHHHNHVIRIFHILRISNSEFQGRSILFDLLEIA